MAATSPSGGHWLSIRASERFRSCSALSWASEGVQCWHAERGGSIVVRLAERFQVDGSGTLRAPRAADLVSGASLDPKGSEGTREREQQHDQRLAVSEEPVRARCQPYRASRRQ